MPEDCANSPSGRQSLTSWWKQFTAKQDSGDRGSILSWNSVQSPSEDQYTDRPTLRYKARSSHNVRSARPVSSHSNSSQDKLRAHRDSFLASQQSIQHGDSQIFGVALNQSLSVAEARISVSSDLPGELIQYGRIPVVVAKCGVFLKGKGLDTEGIFRVGGASRRVKELQFEFSSPPTYGKKLDWDGYTVHDASSLLRRFLNSLPEPLVPLSLYEEFREPLRSRPRILKYLKHKEAKDAERESDRKREANRESQTEESPEEETARKKRIRKQRKLVREIHHAVKEYTLLVHKLPPLSRHLLFYILDLLAIFASHSDKNRMPAKNLAAIFQPSILSHPDHDLSPEEYALSQSAVEFLVEYSYKLLPAAQKVDTSSAPSQREPSIDTVPAITPSKGYRPNVTRKHSKSLSSANVPPDTLALPSFQINHHNSSLHKLRSHSSNVEDEQDDDSESNDEEHRPQLVVTSPSNQVVSDNHSMSSRDNISSRSHRSGIDSLIDPVNKDLSPAGSSEDSKPMWRMSKIDHVMKSMKRLRSRSNEGN